MVLFIKSNFRFLCIINDLVWVVCKFGGLKGELALVEVSVIVAERSKTG